MIKFIRTQDLTQVDHAHAHVHVEVGGLTNDASVDDVCELLVDFLRGCGYSVEPGEILFEPIKKKGPE